jgi:hypothetical protein
MRKKIKPETPETLQRALQRLTRKNANEADRALA